MQRKLSLILLCVVCCLYLSSCRKEYQKMRNGAMMKFYSVNKNNEKPGIGDIVTIDLIQSIGDSIITDRQAVEIEVKEPYFVGDMMCGILNMHVDDHAEMIFAVDSMFISMGVDIPDFIKPGTLMKIDIVLKSIIPEEIYNAERQRELEDRKAIEDSLLAVYYDDNYTITEDSLIIVNLNKGSGRNANTGDIMKVYFTMQTIDGDTLLSFRDNDEPYPLVYGDKSLGEGFYEALGMVHENGDARFIIPSSLAFGKEGFKGVILPYTSFNLYLKVVDIMTSDEYEVEEKALKEKEERDNLERLKNESDMIIKYVTDNNITVKPSLTGLYYLEKNAGNGESVDTGNTVTINYCIYNINEVLVESSYEAGVPLSFIYGNNEMIPGIEEAVGKMKVGGKSRIIVPSSLGFGDVAINKNLPAYSTLIIDLELVDLKK